MIKVIINYISNLASSPFDQGHQEELGEIAGVCKPHKQLLKSGFIFKLKRKICCLSMAVGVEMTTLYVQMVTGTWVLES